MKIHFLHSTVFKIVALLFTVSFLAIASMVTTVFLSDNAQSDASAVNVAGSLRMQLFRISSHVQGFAKDTETLQRYIDEFEADLKTGILVNQQILQNSNEVAHHHANISIQWDNDIKPLLVSISANPNTIDSQTIESVKAFVNQIELLVGAYQKHAEGNVAKIQFIQSAGLFSTLFLIAAAMLIVHRQIELPLSNLTKVARKIGHGDFTAKAEEHGKGELPLLARTINQMSSSLFRAQSQLEDQVKRKTRQLSRSNKSLDLLFQVSRKMNEVDTEAIDLQPVMDKLTQVTGVKDLDLCIMTAQGSGPYEHLMTTIKALPDKCAAHQCDDCTEHDQLFPSASNQLRYQLSAGEEHYGVLVVHPDEGQSLDDWQHQLFEAVAEQVANGLSKKRQNEQKRRMALMNERTVIARELHDSLAQALSYLKIQVTRLQKMQQKQSSQEDIDAVIGELKGGLAAAYSELRELLTTFRLKLDGRGIKSALEQTIAQLKSRSDSFECFLDYRVGNIPFTPQEEIHLLQIAREATQNAFHHSQGSRIEIGVTSNKTSQVTLTVKDDGVGIADDPSKLNHYGLAIMMERSRNLEGELSVKRNEDRGTIVQFVFTPEYARETELKIKSA